MSAYNLRGRDTIPITERPNELTFDIDLATASDITKTLRQCDSQIFSGWKNSPSIYDKEAITAMDRIAEKAAEMLQNSSGDTAIVLSGCGTSGRLAFFLSRKFSQLAKAQHLSACYEYLIAGGDIALFTSQEAPEDNWKKGQEDLIEVSRNKKRVLFIGITCGLSAPYVAGQLDYCIKHSDIFIPVLLGFNPVHQARQILIEGWDKSFFDVANKLKELDKIILNPVVGPEAVTGSSRMKGGSATKILLESTLLKAHATLYWPKFLFYKLTQIVMMYESMYRRTYLNCYSISRAVELAAQSLRYKGHVYYIGWGSLGFMGLLDASECVPTFSANFNDVRGFLQGGYRTLNNKEGQLFLNGSNKLYISLQDFRSIFLPELTLHDTVIFICPDCKETQEVRAITKLIEKSGAQLIGIIPEKEVELSTLFSKCFVPVSYSDEDLFEEFQPRSALYTNFLKECFLEISVKWILNAISTGAHVLKGRVLRNLMIDVKVSNNKLFHRAVSVVSTFARVDHERALHAILQAIYRKDIISDVVDRQVSEHVVRGSAMDLVVPVAVLVATGKFNIKSAVEILKTKTVSRILRNIGLVC